MLMNHYSYPLRYLYTKNNYTYIEHINIRQLYTHTKKQTRTYISQQIKINQSPSFWTWRRRKEGGGGDSIFIC
nr:hypothetical protein [Cnaphalocrocis medinalis granulovirus]